VAPAAPAGPPFKKVLIANRGEIALRVIWACRELGVHTVAVYSEADRDSLHVRFADQAVCIGPPRSTDSYLNIPAIISAAEITGADAIHPGYGFLSESSYLAEICEACRITFIGPGPRAIRLMGDKSRAKQAMRRAGVPILPGSEGVLEDEQKAAAIAESTGFPVILKASAGGGGRGMRIVRSAAELGPAFRAAQAEASAAFGVPDVYLERYVQAPRHVEIQILADGRGSVVHLGERECSVQRRHQKLIEEAPAPTVSEKLRRRMGRTAVDAAASVGYCNAGTIEFLLDEDGRFYFMEMNTRIQVEHGVTELVTGRDLVKEQIQIAAGRPLSFAQKDVEIRGHAIECRVNAEDPDTWVPSPGTIRHFHLPGGPGVRVDTFAHEGCVISPYYDSLVAKLMTHGRDRSEALARMRRALDLMVVEGIRTSIPAHRRIMDDPDFIAGRIDTRFMDRYLTGRKAKAS
jgi:acetyl-CoA carboxylase biotin carboxylase subunit